MNVDLGTVAVGWFLRLAGALSLVAAVGCASGDQPVELSGAASSTTTSASTSGSGGSGGEVGTGGADGGMGGSNTLPCGVDCSTISTPVCKIAFCDENIGQCVVDNSPENSGCDDGMFCTVNDACVLGVCTGGGQNTCGLSDEQCQDIVCDEVGKTCSQTAEPDGATCASPNLCELGSTCIGGACTGGTLNDCFFAPKPSDCHVAVCNPTTGMCDPYVGNDGGPCTDEMDPCTVNKTCSGGTCIGGSPKDCSSQNSDCNIGVCDANANGQCVPQAVPAGGSCPSGTNSCNAGICDALGVCIANPLPGIACPESTDSCNAGICDALGVCVANPTVGVQCPEATDDCNQGICDANGLCAANAANEAGACNDGSSCTTNTTCTAGACGGGQSTVTIYFSEDFSSNAAGWTVENEWSIGPAVGSPATGSCGNGDPATDHSNTADNGIAGVVIGGNALTTTLHGLEYVTSPVVDTSAVVGPLTLGYYRWLNSDYTPFMQNNVEVFDGTSWVVVWQTGGLPGVQDAAWTFNSHDITAYKNANMQVRFGFLVGAIGAFTCSQWNLDDVLISNVACP